MSRDLKQRRFLGFPIILLSVVVLGIGMVAASREMRAVIEPPRVGYHWHSAYGVYDCDSWVEPFRSESDPNGIHSHTDGVIHIHPWNNSATGINATLDVFFGSMGVKVTKDEISSSETGVLKAGSDCNGESTEIRVVRFTLADLVLDIGEVYTAFNTTSNDQEAENLLISKFEDNEEAREEYTDNFHDIRILSHLEAFTIARVPASATVPLPPSDRIMRAFRAGVDGRPTSEVVNTVPPPALPTDVETGGEDVVDSDGDGESGGDDDSDSVDSDRSDGSSGGEEISE